MSSVPDVSILEGRAGDVLVLLGMCPVETPLESWRWRSVLGDDDI